MKAKQYDVTMNVGRCRYLLAFCSGEKTYSDGSLQVDVRLYRNRKELDKQICRLRADGYEQF